VQRIPIDVPGWSPYVYTLCNPLNYFDPDGMSVDSNSATQSLKQDREDLNESLKGLSKAWNEGNILGVIGGFVSTLWSGAKLIYNEATFISIPGFAVIENTTTTFLYQKVSKSGRHLKFGITKNPAIRYTQKELAGGKLRIITKGSRSNMLFLERKLHETLPIGPEEAQKFYINLQKSKGLKIPPY